MIEDKTSENKASDNLTTLKVLHKNESTYSVYFPFSDVPVEMSHSYFAKNINKEKYIIDFQDDRKPA